MYFKKENILNIPLSFKEFEIRCLNSASYNKKAPRNARRKNAFLFLLKYSYSFILTSNRLGSVYSNTQIVEIISQLTSDQLATY